MARRFDEIVSFAGVERFIDTPVKRYSSGMYLRLAFSVAAHIEPDILVVDEVLAVGDAEFQAKCVGRMHSAEREGRTVVFVSHNLDAVAQLCTEAIWLERGVITAEGSTESVVDAYVQAATTQDQGVSPLMHTGDVTLDGVRLVDETGETAHSLRRDRPFGIEVTYTINERVPALDMSALVFNASGMRVLDEAWSDTEGSRPDRPGTYTVRISVPPVSMSVNTGSASGRARHTRRSCSNPLRPPSASKEAARDVPSGQSPSSCDGTSWRRRPGIRRWRPTPEALDREADAGLEDGRRTARASSRRSQLVDPSLSPLSPVSVLDAHLDLTWSAGQRSRKARPRILGCMPGEIQEVLFHQARRVPRITRHGCAQEVADCLRVPSDANGPPSEVPVEDCRVGPWITARHNDEVRLHPSSVQGHVQRVDPVGHEGLGDACRR